MRRFAYLLILWLRQTLPSAVATAAFAAVLYGLLLLHEALPWLLGGSFVFGCVAWRHLRGG